MSDYLSHIAAKALNLVPVIEPRPTSLFEPTPGLRESSDNLLTDRVIDEAPDVAALGSIPAADLPPLQGQTLERPPAFASSRHADITPPMAAPTVSVGRTQAVWSTPQTAAPATATSIPEASADVVMAAMVSFISPTEPRAAMENEPLAQDRRMQPAPHPSLPTVEAVEPHVPFEPPPSPRLSASSHTPGDVPLARVRPLGTEERRSAPSHPTTGQIVVQALVTPATESPLGALGEPTPPQTSQPMIRVSIGRIDVRAVLPQAPAAPRSKAARPSAKPSLEEYLKFRQGGQR